MDYNTAMSQFEEDLERAIHSGNKERIEAIKCEINSLKMSRLEWFHNGFYDHKTGEWHTMKPDDAAYLANCGMSVEEIVEYVSSREEPTNPFPGYKFNKNSESNYEVGMSKEPVNMDNVKDISNLIADMVFKGATEDDIVKAVRYSVDVMNAEKSVAIMNQSYIDNGISELKKKYLSM